MKRVRKIFFLILCGILIATPASASVLYQLTGQRLDVSLTGVSMSSEKPIVTSNTFLNGIFQSEYEEWLNTNLIPRGLLTRGYNQIRYSLFNLGSGGVIGKNDDIFGLEYFIQDYLGLTPTYDFSSEENMRAMQSYVDHLESIQDKLEKIGKHFLFYTTGTKAEFHSENIPNQYLIQEPEKHTRAIDVFQEMVYKTDIHYFDTNEILEQHTEYPVFYKTGVHWARPVEQEISNALLQKMEEISGMEFQNLQLGDIKVSDQPFWRDNDVYDLQNIFMGTVEPYYYEYNIWPEYIPKYDKLKVLKQGASFSEGLEYDYIKYFPFSTIYYINYDKYLVYNENWQPLNGWENLELSTYLDQVDFVVIEANEAALAVYSNGFVEYLDLYLDSYIPSESSQISIGVNFDASTLSGSNLCAGFYQFEEDFSWSTGKSFVTLTNPSITEKGLEIELVIPQEAIQLNGQRIVIYVNQKKIHDSVYQSGQTLNLVWDPVEFGISENHEYEIELYTSNQFSYADMGIDSSDTRILSTQVKYIGEKL